MDILALGDPHFPFHSKWAFSRVFDIVEKYQPRIIVQAGDLFDLYSMSRFPRSHNVMTPRQEIEEGRAAAIEMWEQIRKRAKHAKCYQIKGNHDARLGARLMEKLPELAGVVSFDHLWDFKGVHTVQDERQELILDDVVVQHGHYTKLGKHCLFNGMNTIHGHTHRGGVYWHYEKRHNPDSLHVFWELDAGYLGDPTTAALTYTKQKFDKWTIGVGCVDVIRGVRVPYFWPFTKGMRI